MSGPRWARPEEAGALAGLWHRAWHEGHAGVVPDVLTRLRTLDSFQDRAARPVGLMRAAGPVGAPLGFCMIRKDELKQLFVAAEARGTGVAAALLGDAEERLRAEGVRRGWLACAIGNDRAAAFYRRRGWDRVATVENTVETAEGPFTLKVWRFEKALG